MLPIRRLTAALVLIAGCASAPPPPPPPPCPPCPCACSDAPKKEAPAVTELDVGVLVYDIGVSDTAQVFHIADQAAHWSEFSHKQYGRWLEAEHAIGPAETSALEAHRALRKRLHYGAIDQSFYSMRAVDAALAASSLPPADVEIERTLFRVMTPKAMPLVERERPNVAALRDAIVARKDTLAKMLTDLAAFAEVYTPKEHVPLWLLASTDPANGGGGFNGGQMTLEASRSAANNLMHESLHFVLKRRGDVLTEAARSCGGGLDRMTLEEGIAYALFPGILGNPGDIKQTLDRLRHEGRPADDSYVRFNRLGLALTPLLEKALVDKTKLTALLPEACAAWKRISAEAWP